MLLLWPCLLLLIISYLVVVKYVNLHLVKAVDFVVVVVVVMVVVIVNVNVVAVAFLLLLFTLYLVVVNKYSYMRLLKAFVESCGKCCR